MKKHSSFYVGEQIHLEEVPLRLYSKDEDKMDWIMPILAGLMILATLALILFGCRDHAYAGGIGYSVEQIADAIYKAEGGAKTRHPYGILAKYKTTTPRQACINTIKHAQRDWNGKGDFLAFLANRYCPIGAKNDPKNLNVNWLKNVRYFLGVSNV